MRDAVRRRARLGPVALVGLASAGLLVVAASRPWAEAVPKAGGTDPRAGLAGVEVSGADVAPLVLPLGLVALAAWGAVLVLRRRGRRVVSVLGLLAGAGAAVTAAALAHTAPDVAASSLGDVSAELSTTAWPFASVVAGALTAAAFALAWWVAPAWPEMSSRYDAPTGRGEDGPADEDADTRELWKALDEGRDPTA